MQARIRVLVVMPRESRAALIDKLHGCGVELLAACRYEEARGVLSGGSTVDVVLTAVKLPDGTWQDVLDAARSSGCAPVIVCAAKADSALWREVTHSGAHDLLVEPYSTDDLRRSLEQAAARRYMHALRLGPTPEKHVKIPRFAEVA